MERRPPLPTVFRGAAGCQPPPTKRKKSNSQRPVEIYNKDIICLPYQPDDNVLLPIPRGEKRSKLAEMGLVGKIALHSVWQAAQVEAEVSSVYASAFGLSTGEVLPYVYLRYDTHLFCVVCNALKQIDFRSLLQFTFHAVQMDRGL